MFAPILLSDPHHNSGPLPLVFVDSIRLGSDLPLLCRSFIFVGRESSPLFLSTSLARSNEADTPDIVNLREEFSNWGWTAHLVVIDRFYSNCHSLEHVQGASRALLTALCVCVARAVWE